MPTTTKCITKTFVYLYLFPPLIKKQIDHTVPVYNLFCRIFSFIL